MQPNQAGVEDFAIQTLLKLGAHEETRYCATQTIEPAFTKKVQESNGHTRIHGPRRIKRIRAATGTGAGQSPATTQMHTKGS